MSSQNLPFHKTLISVAITMATFSHANLVQATTISDAQITPQSLSQNEDLEITDSGSISVSGSSTEYPIDGGEGYAGTITNNGSISAEATSKAYGVFFNNNGSYDITGSLTNNGSITANATADTTLAIYSYGIFAQSQDLNSNAFINNQTITSTANNSGDTHSYGIIASDLEAAQLLNNGSIEVNSTSTTGRAFATGILLNDIETGSSVDFGNITINLDGHSRANTYVVEWSDSDIDMLIDGDIIVNANSDAGDAEAYIYYLEYLQTDWQHNGSITADVTGDTEARISVFDFNSGTDTGGAFSDNGTINLSAITNTGTAQIEYMELDSSIDVSINNNATISANTAGDIAYTTYIDAEGVASTGILSNSGLISLSSSADNGNAETYYLTGATNGYSAGGVINNSGTLSLDSSTSQGSALSVYLDADGPGNNNFDSDVTNTGTINIFAEGTLSAEAYNYLIKQSDDDAEGSFTNNGTINLLATTESGYAYNYGLYLDDPTDFDFISDNQLTLTANSGSGNAINTLLYVNGDFDGDIRLSGITTLIGSSDSGAITQKVLETDGEMLGDFTHEGTTNITSTSSGRVNSSFFYSGSETYGDIENSGEVTIVSTSDSYIFNRLFAFSSGDFYGSAVNSGTATLVANADDYSNSYGMLFTDASTASIINSGTINITNISGERAYTYGITANNLYDSDIDSSGNITISSTSADTNNAYGILIDGEVDEDSSIIVNDISVHASTGESPYAAFSYGILIDELNGSLTVNGNVSASVDNYNPISKAYTVRINDGTGTFINNGTLSGLVEVDAAVDFINNGTINLTSDQDAYSDGTYAQSASGVLNLGLGTMQNASLWSATTANFASGSTINFNFDSDVSVGDSFDDVIEAMTSLDIGSASITDSSYLLDANYTIDGNTLDLNVTQGNSFADALSESGDALKGAAHFWDDIFINGTSDAELNTVLGNLKTYASGEQIASAIAGTLPNGAQAAGDTANNVSGTIGNVVSGRQRNTRGGGISTGDEMLAERNFWVKPFYSRAQQDNSNGAYGYDADTYGTALGIDTELRPGHRIGAAVFYSQSDINVNNMEQTSEIDSFNAMIYGSLPVLNNKTHIDWQAGLGVHKNDSTRYVALNNSTATADYSSYSAQLSGTLSREHKLNSDTLITPYIKGSYQYQKTDDYSETGAGSLNLNVGSSNSDRLLLGAGASIERQVSPKLVLTAKAGLNYDVLGNNDAITSSYAGDSSVSFATEGVDVDELSFEGGLGINYKQDDHFSAEFAYDVESSSGFDNQSVSAKLKWRF